MAWDDDYEDELGEGDECEKCGVEVMEPDDATWDGWELINDRWLCPHCAAEAHGQMTLI
jgi:rubredoxin